jgi:hypothetical protein
VVEWRNWVVCTAWVALPESKIVRANPKNGNANASNGSQDHLVNIQVGESRVPFAKFRVEGIRQGKEAEEADVWRARR